MAALCHDSGHLAFSHAGEDDLLPDGWNHVLAMTAAKPSVTSAPSPQPEATSTIRRTLTAASAGALALLGGILGTTGAYLALIAAYLNHLSTLNRVPVVELRLLIVALPLSLSLLTERARFLA